MTVLAEQSLRVVGALPAPAELAARVPLDGDTAARIAAHRRAVGAVVSGVDDRLLVVAGPCSVHDPGAALEYAARLAAAAAARAGELLVVLRAYLEKPRSLHGWKGFLSDPGLDGGGDLARGLAEGRRFLVRAAATGLPLAYEFVDPFLGTYMRDTVSWGAIGARTVSSQAHRQFASALPMPVGMKNGVGGDTDVAVAAVRAAAASHVFAGLGEGGEPSVLASAGNPHCHVVLRGGRAPNHDERSVARVLDALRQAGLPPRLMVDAAHGNSGKDYRRQPAVVADVAGQVAAGRHGLLGVMLESFLEAGRQEPTAVPLRHGVSVTDPCLGWPETERCLDVLAEAVRSRRAARHDKTSPVWIG